MGSKEPNGGSKGQMGEGHWMPDGWSGGTRVEVPERRWGSSQVVGFQSGVGFQTGDGVPVCVELKKQGMGFQSGVGFQTGDGIPDRGGFPDRA